MELPTRCERDVKVCVHVSGFVLWFFLSAFVLSPSAFDVGRTRKPIYNLNRCDKFDVVNCNESLFSLSSCCFDRFWGEIFWKISRVGNNVSIWYQENALTRIKIWIEISKHAFFILNFSQNNWTALNLSAEYLVFGVWNLVLLTLQHLIW